MIPNQLSPQSMACKGSNATGVLLICIMSLLGRANSTIMSTSSLRGGVQGKFFWRIRFELWAPQVPLIIGETFGEVLGPRRLTVSEPRPAQKLGVK